MASFCKILPIHICKLLQKERNLFKLDLNSFKITIRQRSTVQPSIDKKSQMAELSDKSLLNPFDSLDEDKKMFLDNLTIPMKTSFNLAAYVNHSKSLQELIKLGVSLYDIENTNREAAQYYLTLEFEKNCVEHIKFLVDIGLKEKNLGKFISEYPLVFKESIDELKSRIEYFKKKKFSQKQIAKALNRSSFILSFKTKTIDHKLGQLQIEFNLPAFLLRSIVTNYPNVVALDITQFKLTRFTLHDEFGFNDEEIYNIILEQPSILEMRRDSLIERIDFVHNTIGLSHHVIALYPKLINGPLLEITQRFKYLDILNRNQFNPKKPLYVPPTALYNISDEEFCSKYAKTHIEDYKLFLKSR